ncbi:MAG: AMP-binding protein [Nisaea sp.]|uniref:AMP-binding protein n=1 Tax=Nisaea sp. TaxID=2024842 RepID=UPI001B2BDD20|nr:AMP-binding protein [Nisaea sp.]MBO6558912.1 AMP-binding protein [Nisaea sp.]
MSQAESLPGLLSRLAAEQPHNVALVDGARSVSFKELEEEVDRVASGLASLGIAKGDRIAVWLPNGIPMAALVFGAARLGAISVIVNTRYQKTELEELLKRTRAKLLAIAAGFRGIPFLDILSSVPDESLSSLTHVVNCSPEPATAPVGATVSYATLAATAPEAFPPVDPALPCAMFATSGTTRAPKLVMHCQQAIVQHGKDSGSALGYTDADAVMLGALPLCGVFGFSQLMGALANGRPTILMDAFSSSGALELIERHKVTHFNATDDMIVRLLDEAKPGQLASLRELGFASFSGTNAEGLVERAEREAGIILRGLFGMSELQALFAAQPANLPLLERAKPGGYPVSSEGQARVCDPETGAELPAGEMGALQFKGPSQFIGYFEDPEATAAAVSEDGWFSAGDAGVMEPDGRFHFKGRMGDTMRLGGFLVSPREIEGVLEDHQDVASAQVVGVQADDGPVAVAFVIAAPGRTADPEALRAHCVAQLAKYKVPRLVLPVTEFATVTGPNGTKVQKQKLREMAEAALKSA